MYLTGEQLDLSRVTTLWTRLESTWQEVLRLQDSPPTLELTYRNLDKNQTSGHRAYIGAERYMHCAMDNHRAMVALLTKHGASPWAPWNLLRPTFEASFYALWILEPSDSLTRRQRGLRLEIRDNIERANYWGELGKVKKYGAQVREALAAREAKVGKTYRTEAQALKLEWKHARASVNVVDEIYKLQAVKLADTNETAALAAATWRSLSGIQHGYGYALLGGSTVSAEVPVPGGQLVTSVISDEAFQTAAEMTGWMLYSAFTAYIERCTRVPTEIVR